MSELEDLRAEVRRWREKAQEAGEAYANANTKHHAELDRANRLERLADTLAGRVVELEDRARAAEAKLRDVEAWRAKAGTHMHVGLHSECFTCKSFDELAAVLA